MFTAKEVWDRVCSAENQFFNSSSRDSKMGLLAQTTTFTTFVARQRNK